MKPGNLYFQGANSCRYIIYKIREIVQYGTSLLIEEFFYFNKILKRRIYLDEKIIYIRISDRRTSR